jgi:hypothetical protein
MPDDINVQLDILDDAKSFNWGGEDKGGTAAQYQVRIAEIKIKFPELSRSLAEDRTLQDELQSLFQDLADQTFGAERITVAVQLKAGSLTILAVLLLAPGGYKFFKDYKQLHEGVVLFAKDLEATGRKIKEIIKKRN